MYSLVLATALRKAALEVRGVSVSLLGGGGFAARRFGEGLGEALFEAVEAAEGIGVGGVGCSVARRRVGGDDEVDLFLDVVEGEDLVEEHEVGVGDVEFVGGERGEALDLADDVVGEEADGSGGEGRQAGEAGGGVAGEGVA